MSLFGDVDPKAAEKNPLTEDEVKALERFADFIDRWGMNIPAIMFVEAHKPANFLVSQAMVFAEPIANPVLQMFFRYDDYDNVRTALEKRHAPERLIEMIEEREAVNKIKARAFKKWYRQEKKSWKWYQRYFGIAKPEVHPPHDVIHPPELQKLEEKKSAQKKKDES